MDKEQLKDLLKSHKPYLTTVARWDEYAKTNNLPSSNILIYKFGSWNALKKELKLPTNRRYTASELKEIALEHKDYFQRKNIWQEYSKKHGLPTATTFISQFGSWNKVKETIGLKNDKKKNDIYSKEQLKDILEKHASHYENRKQWDEYAKEKKLPTYKTIRKHFSYEEILEIVNKKKKMGLTEEELIKIALEHKDIFLNSSITKWNEYAAKFQLPSSYKYHRTFGTWKKAKVKVIQNMYKTAH